MSKAKPVKAKPVKAKPVKPSAAAAAVAAAPPSEVAVVLVPADVFSAVMKILAVQPYEEVGNLMNTLGTYKAQMVRVQTAPPVAN